MLFYWLLNYSNIGTNMLHININYISDGEIITTNKL